MSESKPKGQIAELAANRASLIELFMVSFVLALGLNVVSTVLEANSRTLTVGIGIAIALLAFAWYVVVRFWSNRREVLIEGTILYDGARRELIDIPNYSYSEKVGDYCRALFREKPSSYLWWMNYSMSGTFHRLFGGESVRNDEWEGPKLIQEVTEYFVVHELELHLSKYFGDDRTSKERVTNLTRDDLPASILMNQFLDLFSTPPHKRSNVGAEAEELSEDVVFAVGPRYYFSRFHLTLPKGSEIHRDPGSWIRIENNSIRIRFRVEFDGSNVNVPRSLMNKYVGIDSDKTWDIEAYRIPVRIQSEIKRRTVMSLRGWRYQAWLDSFTESIESRMSFNSFLEHIGWPILEALIHIQENRNTYPDGSSWGYREFLLSETGKEATRPGRDWEFSIERTRADCGEGDEALPSEPGAPNASKTIRIDYKELLDQETKMVMLVLAAIVSRSGDQHSKRVLEQQLLEFGDPQLEKAIGLALKGDKDDAARVELSQQSRTIIRSILDRI